MKLKLVAVVMVVVSATAVLGASAYTTGSVERQANVNVVTDGSGLIGLADGTSGDLVFQNSSGALEIDFGQGAASGVNADATFELGDQSDPTNKTAFNITNNDATSHDLTVEYTGSDSEDADANLQFQVYDGTGTKVGTASEESGSVTLTGVASGETLYVVLVVDTHGLSSATDLSGTLKVSA